MDLSLDLNNFNDIQLLALARNEACAVRHDAMALLVQRGSPLAEDRSIADEVTELLQDKPEILGKAEDAAATLSKLPTVTDKLSKSIDLAEKGTGQLARALERRAERQAAAKREAAIREDFSRQARILQAGLALQDSKIGHLRNDVKALAERFASTSERGKSLAQRLEAEIDSVERRLAFLERSPFQKVVDCLKKKFRRS